MKKQAPLEQLMTTKEVAEYLRVKEQSLANMRNQRRSIPFHKFGRKVLYRRSDVEAALNAGRFGQILARQQPRVEQA